MKVRLHHEKQKDANDEENRQLGRANRAAIDACALCDDFGWILNVEPLRRCKHSTSTRLQTGS